MFDHDVTKLLYLCKQACPGIQTVVAFLTTIVKNPDEDDLKKLHIVMRYLRYTSHIPLTLEANVTHIINCLEKESPHDFALSHKGTERK